MTTILTGVLGSLGLLLLGMKLLEEGMQFFLSGSVRQYFHTLVQNKYIWRLVWVVLTPILQSSSLVSLILVSFVGSGLISLLDALGVIAGMNVGITLVPLVLAKIWFTWLDLGLLALPLIGIWGLILAIFKHKIFQKSATIAIGFGLVLWSIQLMKGYVWWLETYIDLSIYAHLSPRVFLGIWLIATAVIQSSLAVVLIAISAVYSGILPLEAAIFVVMGANIGTTTTAMLWAIGRNMTKQQVATAHVLFNICLALQWWILIDIYMSIGQYFFADDLHIQVALINFLFNLVTSVVLLLGIQAWRMMTLYIRPDRKRTQLLQTMQDMYQTSAYTSLTANTRLWPLLDDIDMYTSLLRDDIVGQGTDVHLSHIESHLMWILGLRRRRNESFKAHEHAMIYTKINRTLISLNKAREDYKELVSIQSHMKEYNWYWQDDMSDLIDRIHTYISAKITWEDVMLDDTLEAWSVDMDTYIQGIHIWDEEQSKYIQYSGYIQKYKKYISLLFYDWDDASRSLANAREVYEKVYV